MVLAKKLKEGSYDCGVAFLDRGSGMFLPPTTEVRETSSHGTSRPPSAVASRE